MAVVPRTASAFRATGSRGRTIFAKGLNCSLCTPAPPLSLMAQLIQKRRAPSEVMGIIADRDAQQTHNALCPCGSGDKFRKCHGNQNPQSPFSRLDLAPVEAGISAD